MPATTACCVSAGSAAIRRHGELAGPQGGKQWLDALLPNPGRGLDAEVRNLHEFSGFLSGSAIFLVFFP
jgi:hypothetical protein